MNMSRLASHLKMSLGLNTITLPFKDEITGDPTPITSIINEVLTVMTIPVFSQFAPWTRDVDVKVKQMKAIDVRRGIYLLPAGLTTTPVISILSVRRAYNHESHFHHNNLPVYGMGASVQRTATGIANNLLAGEIQKEPTNEYLGDNKIKLYGWRPDDIVSIVAACEHLENGETIEDSCYDSVLQLASYDMKIFLYNQLKLYENQSSAHGQIQLKLDNFQGAEQERETLLEKWRDTFHLDMDNLITYF